MNHRCFPFSSRTAIRRFHTLCGLFLTGLLLSVTAYGQQLPVNCDLAVPACSGQYQLVGTNPPYNTIDFGVGTISNPSSNPGASGNAGCLLSGETVSTFFTIHVNSSGNLQWSAIIVNGSGNPVNEGCLDWILWNVTGQSDNCSGIHTNTVPPVACNWNGVCNGNTGMSAPANYPPGASPTSYEAPLMVTAGQTYILCLSNYSGATEILNFDFFGTAGISCGVDAQDQSVCEGGSVTVSISTPGYDSPEFTWLNTTGVSDPNSGTNVTVTPTATTTYDVAVYQAPVGGLQELFDTATFTIYVDTPVQATTSVTGTTGICEGGALEVEGFPAQDVTYEWLLDGETVSNELYQTFFATEEGDYALVVENSCGSDTSALFTVEFLEPVIAGLIANGQLQFCTGESVGLEATPSPGATYEWLLDGQPIADSVSATLTAFVGGAYSVVVTGECGTDTSTVDVTVEEPLTALLDVMNDTIVICEGVPATLNALPADAVSYAWLMNGNIVPMAGMPIFDAYAAGSYAAVVTNSCGSDTTDGVTVIVNDAPQTPVITVNGDYLVIGPSGGGEMVQWYLDGSEIPGATADMLVAQANGIYTVIVTGANGCQTESAAFTLTNVGLSEQTELSVLIAPNPTKGAFTVHFEQGSLDALTLCDAQGKVITTQIPEPQAGTVSFDLSAYSVGVYLLHVAGPGVSVVERIVLDK